MEASARGAKAGAWKLALVVEKALDAVFRVMAAFSSRRAVQEGQKK
jgi:hypothetical protein